MNSLRASFPGINSHAVALRPCSAVAAALRGVAANGSFVPYSNTEQDTLEAVFHAEAGALALHALGGLPHHQHNRFVY